MNFGVGGKMESSGVKEPPLSVRYGVKPMEKFLFKDSWLQLNIFKDWLQRHDDNTKAFCSVCKKVLNAEKQELMFHSQSIGHINESKIPRRSLPNTPSGSIINSLVNNNKANDNISMGNMIEVMRKSKFSVLVHVNKSGWSEQVLCILIKFSPEVNRRVIKLFELIKIKSADFSASTIFTLFKNHFNVHNIPLSNILSLACDNTDVMIGAQNSFVTHFKKEYPQLIVLKCISQSSVFIASNACSKIPEICNSLLHSVATYDYGRANKPAVLKEFQECFRVESYKQSIRNLERVKWLCMEKCVVRFIENWEQIKCYFQAESTQFINFSAVSHICESFKRDDIKCYFLFLEYSLPYFDQFNALFQCPTTLIHCLSEHSKELIEQLASNFLQPQGLNKLESFSEYILPLMCIHLGPKCEESLDSLDPMTIHKVRSDCLSFYISALTEMVETLPHLDPFFCDLKFLDPSVAFSLDARQQFRGLNKVSTRLGYFHQSSAVAREWQALPLAFKECETEQLRKMNIEQMWKNILEKKSFNGEPRFPHLRELIDLVFLIALSNAEAEELFSTATNIKANETENTTVLSVRIGPCIKK